VCEKVALPRLQYSCAHPSCNFRVHSYPQCSEKFCCKKCEQAAVAGAGPDHGPVCEKALCAPVPKPKCAHPACTFRVHAHPQCSETFCCKKCELAAASGAGPDHGPVCEQAAWEGSSRATCAHPGCNYHVHSNPQVSQKFCCKKCELACESGAGPDHGPVCENSVVGTITEATQPTQVDRNPYTDKVLILLACTSICGVALGVAGAVFLMPLMLAEPSFNIPRGDSVQEFQGNIARALSLSCLPLGFCQILVSLWLFVPVTSRTGERPMIACAGLLLIAVYPVYGFWVDKVWKLAAINAVGGICLGFMIPAIGPVGARYSSKMFPKAVATAQGLPVIGMQIATSFSQNLMALIVGDGNDLRPGWLFCSFLCLLFVLFFSVAHRLAESRIANASKVAEPQHEEPQLPPGIQSSLMASGQVSASLLVPFADTTLGASLVSK